MPGDLSSGEVFLTITNWRSRCVDAGIALQILSGGLGSDGWVDSEVSGGVLYYKVHLRVRNIPLNCSSCFIVF